MKRPLVVLTVFFCLGIIFASRLKIAFLWAYICAALLLLLLITLRRKGSAFDIILAALFFFFGAVIFISWRFIPPGEISRILYYQKDNLIEVAGFVDSGILKEDRRTSFVFNAQEIKVRNLRYACSGKILVHLRGKRNIRLRELLLLTGRLYRPYRFSGNKSRAYIDYLARQKVFLIMSAHQARSLGVKRGWSLQSFAARLKLRAEFLISRHVSNLGAGIMDAMVLGEKKNIPASLYRAMIKTGTVHILPRLYTKMPSVAL